MFTATYNGTGNTIVVLSENLTLAVRRLVLNNKHMSAGISGF
tara:strand:+ start:4466 stop:4591 length:126 start_codon:yes stop_codon:yes gene_type:complete